MGHGRTRVLFAGLAALALAACAAPRALGPGVPAWMELRVGVPDPFPVLAGPPEAYRHLGVGADLRAALASWGRGVVPPAGARMLVSIEDLSASYQEVGAGAPPRLLRLASLGPAELQRDGGDPGIPEEIRKTLRLVARIRLDVPGRRPLDRTEEIEVTRVVRRDDFDRWAYDYRPVWAEALQELVARLDRIARAAGWRN